MRIQISTNVSAETRRQADELMETFGYSLRDVVTVAIEQLYQRKKAERRNPMEITTGFLTANLFDGWTEQDAAPYDEAASAQRYADLCQVAIKEAYPDAQVEVRYKSGATGSLSYHLQTRVNGFAAAEANSTEMDTIAVVDDICGRIYQEYEWCVTK